VPSHPTAVLAVIVTVPTLIPVTIPVAASIAAIVGSELVQVTVDEDVRVTFAPTQTEVGPVIVGREWTVIVRVLEHPVAGMVAVIVTTPLLTPVTSPPAEIVAIAGIELAHVTPAGPRVLVEPTQISVGPVIRGLGFTVTVTKFVEQPTTSVTIYEVVTVGATITVLPVKVAPPVVAVQVYGPPAPPVAVSEDVLPAQITEGVAATATGSIAVIDNPSTKIISLSVAVPTNLFLAFNMPKNVPPAPPAKVGAVKLNAKFTQTPAPPASVIVLKPTNWAVPNPAPLTQERTYENGLSFTQNSSAIS